MDLATDNPKTNASIVAEVMNFFPELKSCINSSKIGDLFVFCNELHPLSEAYYCSTNSFLQRILSVLSSLEGVNGVGFCFVQCWVEGLCDGINFQGTVQSTTPTFTLISKREIYFDNIKKHFIYPIAVAQEKLKLDEHQMHVVMRDFGITDWPYRVPSPINRSKSKSERKSGSSKDPSSQTNSKSRSIKYMYTSANLGKRKREDSSRFLMFDCPKTKFQLMVSFGSGMQFSEIVEKIADALKWEAKDIEYITFLVKIGRHSLLNSDDTLMGLLLYMENEGM